MTTITVNCTVVQDVLGITCNSWYANTTAQWQYRQLAI